MTPAELANMSAFQWVIATVKEPIMWARDTNETWLLNPPLRYIVNNQHLKFIEDHTSSVSALSLGSAYKPLAGEPLRGGKILVERHRDRGIGDHLFMTGIFKLLHHLTGNTCQIYQYALHTRSAWLHGCPWLASETCLTGPLCYDTLHAYDHHWFVDQATEYTSEHDQLNVYDALVKSIGLRPETIADEYKRPYVTVMPDDEKKRDTFFNRVYRTRGLDLRTAKYSIVSPLCNSKLRSIPYTTSLTLIQELAKRGPVIVLGDDNNGLMPSAGVPYLKFKETIEHLSSTNKQIINLIGNVPPRLAIAVVARAQYLVTPDTGLLYVAQGLRVPAVSIWGPHNPFVRLGYDTAYMKLAIHKTETCRNSPCYAYAGWPIEKCPRGIDQVVCEPLLAVTSKEILDKIETICG